MLDPAAVAGAVEAGYDRDFQAVLEHAQAFQVFVEAGLVIRRQGQVTVGLAMTEILEFHQLGESFLLGQDVLLEQGVHDQRRGAGVLEPSGHVQILRQRRGGGHQRVFQG